MRKKYKTILSVKEKKMVLFKLQPKKAPLYSVIPLELIYKMYKNNVSRSV